MFASEINDIFIHLFLLTLFICPLKRTKVHKKCAYPESETANLPRIEDLHITVPEAECIEMGEVHAVVDDQA